MGTFTSLRVTLRIPSITELEGSLKKVAKVIKCQISVDLTVFSHNKIYQSDPQVKENSLNEGTNKNLSEASVNLIHMEASIMPHRPGGC